ncbi:MAG: hypothetical protein II918_03195 [Firmicutes bacterium]|jgi:peptidoglycan/LPS O-acetylase OafA/YrhL|nr:hypothetical protein [Bacillota bacterium]MCR4710429.1 hypothetical protein [Clostridiales bacterium]
MSNKKKKSKNSDYHYMQRQYEAQREEREKAERDSKRKLRRLVSLGSFIMIVISLGLAIYATTQHKNDLAPIYTVTSAVAMMLMAWNSKDTRPTFYKVGMGLGVAMILLAYYFTRQSGLLG